MPTRRTPDAAPASRRELARLSTSQADLRGDFQGLSEDFNTAFDRLTQMVTGLQEEVRRGNLARLGDSQHTATRFQELEIQIGETRDQVNAVLARVANGEGAKTASAAAEGAARGAVRGVAEAAPKRFLATWKGWVITIGAAIAGIAAFVQGLPPIVRFFDGLFGFLGKLK